MIALLVLVDLQVVELHVRDAVAVDAGAAAEVRNACRSSRSVHAAGSGSPVVHTLPRTSVGAIRLIVDAQLHAIPRVAAHSNGTRTVISSAACHGCSSSFCPLPKSTSAVALVDEADVAALARASRRARRPRRCSPTSRSGRSAPWRGARRSRPAAARARCPRPRRCQSWLEDRRPPGLGASSSSKLKVHGSGAITRTRACPVTPPTVAFTKPAEPEAAAVNTPSASTLPCSPSTAHCASPPAHPG